MRRKIIAYKHYFADFVELLTSQEKKLEKAIKLKEEYYGTKTNK